MIDTAPHPATPACNGKPYNQQVRARRLSNPKPPGAGALVTHPPTHPLAMQVFYNVPNVMARIKGRKLDDMWTQETPAPTDRDAALSLRCVNPAQVYVNPTQVYVHPTLWGS
jgi:hypothetical protein